MDNVHDFEWDKRLWRSRPTRLDQSIRKIIASEILSDEVKDQFFDIYIFIRNGMVRTIMDVIVTRRNIAFDKPLSIEEDIKYRHQRSFVSTLITMLNILVKDVRDELISADQISIIHSKFSAAEGFDKLKTVGLELDAIQNPLLKHNYIYRRGENKWYSYVSKAMGVYNVP